MGLPVDEYLSKCSATARCRPKAEVDNRVVAQGKGGCYRGTAGLPVGSIYPDAEKKRCWKGERP
jgi:hypothetical protein